MKRREAAGSVELFRADLADAVEFAKAVRGVDAVIHSAALATRLGPARALHPGQLRRHENAARGRARAGCRTFVYISSAVVHGFGHHVDTSERGPYYPLKYPYQITKMMAEEYVLARNAEGFRTTAIRPCNVYGPGDHEHLPDVRRHHDGIFGYIGSGASLTCPIYVDDLCEASWRRSAAPARRPGYHSHRRPESLVERLCPRHVHAVGSKKRPVGTPKSLAYAAAWLMSTGARAIQRQTRPLLTLYPIEQASQDYHFSNEKARELLGFEPRVFHEEGLARTAKAYLQEGHSRRA